MDDFFGYDFTMNNGKTFFSNNSGGNKPPKRGGCGCLSFVISLLVILIAIILIFSNL